MREICLLLHSPNGCRGWACAGPKPGAWLGLPRGWVEGAKCLGCSLLPPAGQQGAGAAAEQPGLGLAPVLHPGHTAQARPVCFERQTDQLLACFLHAWGVVWGKQKPGWQAEPRIFTAWGSPDVLRGLVLRGLEGTVLGFLLRPPGPSGPAQEPALLRVSAGGLVR